MDELRYRALLLRSPDLVAATAFYCGVLGLEARSPVGALIETVDSAGARFYLEQVPAAPGPLPDQARATAAFQVQDMATAVARLASGKIELLQSSAMPVRGGSCVRFRDCFGNVHSLVETRDSLPDSRTRILQAGIKIPIASMPAAKRLYGETLGFGVASERYYPPLLPMMHHDGTAAFVIEDMQNWERDLRVRAPRYPDETGVVMVFETRDLAAWRSELPRRAPNVKLVSMTEFVLGRRTAFVDTAGLAVEIWETPS